MAHCLGCNGSYRTPHPYSTDKRLEGAVPCPGCGHEAQIAELQSEVELVKQSEMILTFEEWYSQPHVHREWEGVHIEHLRRVWNAAYAEGKREGQKAMRERAARVADDMDYGMGELPACIRALEVE